jgi:hypothetical protein
MGSISPVRAVARASILSLEQKKKKNKNKK